MVVVGSVSLSTVWAQKGTSNAIDSGDTAWILVSSALVLCMTLPGLALFYGGLVRTKNVLGTIMHTAIILCIISIVWVLWIKTHTYDLYKALPGFVAGALVTLLVSKMTAPSEASNA